ncbi:MAG: polar amino acid transport system substrate-binding protein [Paraglaciecola sp.]
MHSHENIRLIKYPNLSFSWWQVIIIIACCKPVAVNGKQLDLAVGWSKPPYVIASGNTGYELDLVRTVLHSLGHGITPIYVPFGRANVMLKQGAVDLALTVKDSMGIDSNQLSDVYITYQNVALSLKENNIHLDTIADLKSYSIVGFQKASLLLGEAYKDAVKKSRLYIELPEQLRQVEMLLTGHTDLVVMDINIFIHLSTELMGENQLTNVDIHQLFAASHYKVAFKDPKLKDVFNLALADFLKSAEHQELVDKYAFYKLAPLAID